MAKRKIYEVSFYLDIHAVTSPGVWLCPKGKVAVRVSLFGVSEITKLLPPVFPLLFHERFHFQKVFRKAGNLQVLETKLARLPVCLQLLQHPEGTTTVVKLAVFKACLGDLLFPTAGADCNLMFCPTKCYPGIIAPMAEVSTRLSVVECDIEDGSVSTLPVTIFSKELRGQAKDHPIRQRAVCHTKHNLYCGCFRNGSQAERKKKKNVTLNRRKSDDWTRKGNVRTAVKPGSAAHQMSHRNHGDNNFNHGLGTRSDSSLDPPHISKEPYSPPDSELYHTKRLPIQSRTKDYYDTYDETPENYEREGQRTVSRSSKQNYERLASPNIQEPRSNRRNSYSSREILEDRLNSYSSENYQEDEMKYRSRDDDAINNLKKELRALLDEENQEGKYRNNGSKYGNKNGVTVCCLCCPKERYDHENFTTSDGKPKNVINNRPSPSCSECFLTACHIVHETTKGPEKTTLKDDIRKRPLFYSNLYAAYQKLSNKKNKKTVWR